MTKLHDELLQGCQNRWHSQAYVVRARHELFSDLRGRHLVARSRASVKQVRGADELRKSSLEKIADLSVLDLHVLNSCVPQLRPSGFEEWIGRPQYLQRRARTTGPQLDAPNDLVHSATCRARVAAALCKRFINRLHHLLSRPFRIALANEPRWKLRRSAQRLRGAVCGERPNDPYCRSSRARVLNRRLRRLCRPDERRCSRSSQPKKLHDGNLLGLRHEVASRGRR